MSKKAANPMKPCMDVLNKVQKHKFAWVFNEPVDPIALEIPDYLDVIKEPMDLGTIKKRLTEDQYTQGTKFAADVNLTFDNAMKYNPPSNDVYAMANSLKELFEKLWKPVGEKYAADEEAAATAAAEEKKRKKNAEANEEKKKKAAAVPAEDKTPKKVAKDAGDDDAKRSHKKRPPMSLDEKQALALAIVKLQHYTDKNDIPRDKLQKVLQFAICTPEGQRPDSEEVELDIGALDSRTLWRLDNYVRNCLNSVGAEGEVKDIDFDSEDEAPPRKKTKTAEKSPPSKPEKSDGAGDSAPPAEGAAAGEAGGSLIMDLYNVGGDAGGGFGAV